MFWLELKRSYHNRVLAYIFGITGIAFMLGWVLPVGIDKVTVLTYEDYLMSLYTVFTQFGFLLFSFGTAYFFNKEYHDKTIIFYQSFKMNSVKVYVTKLSVLFIEEMVALAFFLGIVSIAFHNITFTVSFFGLILAVVLQYFIITGIVGMIVDNMLVALGVSIMLWLFSVIAVTFGGMWKYLAVFDASNDLYIEVDKYLMKAIPNLSAKSGMAIGIELLVLLVMALIIAMGIQKRWKRLGV